MQIAQTILAQLGGNRFIAMIGAKNLLATESGLQFHFPKGAKSRANVCRITLSPSDLYTVEFMAYNRRTFDCKPVGQADFGVYADQLQALFTARTGLYTSL